MNEQSKAAKRRFNDGNFHSKYFRGEGIDPAVDQTLLPNTECCIEIILRKN